ncbi:3-oxoadipate enol-lactonase [Agrobacterium genomosp. 3]|nr:3-oxoadipate enol-lactonase [Agrobacterium tomkonis]MCA1878346.1 3-oxoadipate enol-lactonase [Agrobacterium tumefaciens]MCA1893536.1 3-oxoadipate enol-lactonase [Agrobacterium tomkonis]TXI02984.1 MAG: 3-oxoadipate enol-lactonase [Rhizobium sp.]
MQSLFLDLGTHRLRYRLDGQEGPWLLFSNSLGTNLNMWDAQIADLSREFRILRYDTRGHGESSAPPAPYTLAELGGDILALLDALDIDRANFCGISLGGLTGQWLGINAADRLDRIVLCATAARIGSAESWNARIATVKEKGLSVLREATLERWFTPRFYRAEQENVDLLLKSFICTAEEGYIGCCSALASADFHSELGVISHRVLCISGEDDPVCPPSDLQQIAAKVQNGQHSTLPGKHIVNVESGKSFNKVVRDFFVER